MELTQKFTGTVQARAAIGEDGTVRVQLQGTAPYRVLKREGEGEAKEVDLTASVTVTVTDETLVAPVKAALEAVLNQAGDLLAPQLAQTVHQARAVAAARGEK